MSAALEEHRLRRLRSGPADLEVKRGIANMEFS